jgi:hypothetical protein
MLVSREQNEGQNHNIYIANRSFKYVAKFKYFGTTVTHQSLIRVEIKSRLNSSNPCCHSVQILLSSRRPPKNVKIKICETIYLPVVFWSLTLREEHKLRMFQNRVLKKILDRGEMK